MKNLILYPFIFSCLCLSLEAQVLNVVNNEQEQDQWCWAGSSKTILDYYGYVNSQCQIVEWTRNTATFHNFGSTNCCTNPSQGCNYWNYNYNSAGSIQDILVHFGALQNTGVNSALSQTTVQTELQHNRLFVIRWGWASGGGHFIVGHGLSGNNLYYMNPWFGEGLKIGTYSWVCSGDSHTWTNTNKITTNTTGTGDLSNTTNKPAIAAYPNPFTNSTKIEYTLEEEKEVKINVYNVLGELVYYSNIGKQAKGNYVFNWDGKSNSFSTTQNGVYLVNVSTGPTLKSIRVLKTD